MSELNVIWDKIIDQSLIMKSAIESEDLDIFEQALEGRRTLIEQLKSFESFDQNVFNDYLIKFNEIEAVCEREMLRFKAQLENESLENRKKQHETIKNKQVHDRYQMNLDHSGGTLDSKK